MLAPRSHATLVAAVCWALLAQGPLPPALPRATSSDACGCATGLQPDLGALCEERRLGSPGGGYGQGFPVRSSPASNPTLAIAFLWAWAAFSPV